ncbi:alpha/beta fold hydrolase [Aeromicrobium duanguangcaii]|uniref:alpha/beta fold hydrolase n=1 Tax=Aeromicrobium duanguangcaii TaxID=2968086 RepID=UPI002017B872|nr:alpha/beta fold hydrolase [Aeromicrobium duanguangcaii]MCL3836908.1 alpha/beta hydrolase [Aeromicrobium duanguangcaii]
MADSGTVITRELDRPDGMTIAFHEWNGDLDTPPVVLQHGYVASTETNWVGPGVVDALLAAGHRVIGVDARGHGRSGTSADSALFGEPTMARDLSAVMDELDVTEYQLVGYSMGAIISLLTAAADPRVTRLVVGGVGSAVVELGGVDTRLVDGELLVGALLAEGDLSVYPSGARLFRQLADVMGSHRPSLAAQAQALHAGPTDLARVTVPTLVLAGRDDVLATNPQVLADALPDARLRVVDGDHLGAVSAPDFIASLTTFLAG